jgi:spore germination cell wall hydrolase CwlJ-like protein
MDLQPQMHCVAQAVYSEARSESTTGQRAVAHVIMNRAKSGRFPTTYCGVVKQRGQFTYRTGTGPLWEKVKKSVLNMGLDPTNGALYFKAKHAKVKWAYKLVATIGGHLFYK